MISDVLFDAILGIEHHLESQTFSKDYPGEIREEIDKLVLDMKRVVCKLDRVGSSMDADIQQAKESVKH